MKRLIPTILCAPLATVAGTGLYRPTGNAAIPDTRVSMGKRDVLLRPLFIRSDVCNIPLEY